MNKRPLWAPDKRVLPDEYYEELKDFSDEEDERIKKVGDFLIIDDVEYIPSLNNPCALLLYDKGHHEILDFPLCPVNKNDNSLETYFNNLKVEENLIEGYACPFLIAEFSFNPQRDEIWIRCKQSHEGKVCENVQITLKEGYYVHFIDTFYPYYELNDDGDQEFYYPWESSRYR
ncbi:MAG: hypothetical protein E7004_06540 [Alphaproteobacteria bacterium]|nr:hypothetical protein [Alphaproteobacteria bacterium]